jgi:hypothetical protein
MLVIAQGSSRLIGTINCGRLVSTSAKLRGESKARATGFRYGGARALAFPLPVVSAEFNGLAMRGMAIGVRPGVLARGKRGRIGEAFFRDQPT